MPQPNGQSWATSDLGTAAYAHMRGLKIRGVRRAPRGGGTKFVFVFEDPERQGERLQVEYMNSECRDFDAKVRSLKKLCYEDGDGTTHRGR